MAISDILNEYIIKSKERLNASNVKTYCKCCVEALGEEEGKKFFFPNTEKKNQIFFSVLNLEF